MNLFRINKAIADFTHLYIQASSLVNYLEKMPILKIFTNISKNGIPNNFIPTVISVLSECVKKPEEVSITRELQYSSNNTRIC